MTDLGEDICNVKNEGTNNHNIQRILAKKKKKSNDKLGKDYK